MNREFRGELDMEVQIENLKKQKQYLQSQCRKAGLLINMQKQELLSLKNVIDNLQKRIDDLRKQRLIERYPKLPQQTEESWKLRVENKMEELRRELLNKKGK